jgi:hypothetical protein
MGLSMRSSTKVPGEAPKKMERLGWVRAIFYLHFAIVYLSIVSFWCYLFYHEYFTFPEKSDMEMTWKVQGFLFCGTPLAISFAGLVARVKGSWDSVSNRRPNHRFALLHVDHRDQSPSPAR